MSNDFKPEDKDLIKKQVHNILEELSAQNDSEFIEADMVALFEDIIQFFSGREEEFLNFANLSVDAKRAIYTEIKNIIILLKKLKKDIDKQMILQMLSKNLIANLDKKAEKFKSAAAQLKKQELKNLKRRFADAALLELYRKRQLYIARNKKLPKKLTDEIEHYVEKIRQSKKKIVAKHPHSKTTPSKNEALNISRKF